MSEPVVTVFKLLGRAEHQTYDKRTNEWKADLLIEPMMVREGSDETPLEARQAGLQEGTHAPTKSRAATQAEVEQ